MREIIVIYKKIVEAQYKQQSAKAVALLVVAGHLAVIT